MSSNLTVSARATFHVVSRRPDKPPVTRMNTGFQPNSLRPTVSGERMKAGKEHRVPLSAAALAVLDALPDEDRGDLVFASPRGGMLSDMSLTAVLRRMKVDAVPHGFRSSFRDWCAERTNYPREMAEMALPHVIGDEVEAAYRRGDLFEKRRRLMKDWAAFCANPGIRKGSVISMKPCALDGIF